MAEPDVPTVLYLLGAGRSGTTVLSALLNSHSEICWRGELIHLAHWEDTNALCSCGQPLRECEQWRASYLDSKLGPDMQFCHQFEAHGKVPGALLSSQAAPPEYCTRQAAMFRELRKDASIVLDSSKYIARALALASCPGIKSRFLYIVRDPRGVAHSFGKNVQSSRGTLSASVYYAVVNVLAMLAIRFRLRDRCLKIRYEDFVSEPQKVLADVGRFLELDMQQTLNLLAGGERFAAQHVAGGNRWVQEGSSTLVADFEWEQEMSTFKRLFVHLLCLPLQWINGYKFR